MIRRTWPGFAATFAVAFLLAGIALAQETPLAAPSTMAPPTSVATPGATPNVGAQQNPFFGGLPQGQPTPEVIGISLQDAINRGLKYNLGLFLSQQGGVSARAARLRSLSDLLPNLTVRATETAQQINLAALGFSPSNLSRFGFNSIVVGPFDVFDTRGFLSESLDFKALNNFRANSAGVRAADFSVQDARDLVVLVVGFSYINAVSGAARVNAVSAQVNTAESLYQQAVDMKRAGMIAGIDLLRAQVELQVQQQRLLAVQNAFEKQKLTLGRAIGLPGGQQFKLTDAMPYAPPPPLELERALRRAYDARPDYKAALQLRRAAELARKAAVGQALPSIQFNADYGTIGPTPGTSHGTFTAAAGLKVPIFQGGKVRADVQQADALLRQREAQAEDMRARIELEVRSAFLDLTAATKQVEVARNSVGLATEQVQQARDRFAAGVANNIEVVQAQEALAATNDNYIASLFAHNFAKLELARAVGIAEQAVKEFVGGPH